MEPLVSYIVPVYKVESTLDRCVSSILGQTFRDFELILVDDGSPDSCPAMCDAYAQADSRVRVIHQVNHGLSMARNIGIEVARGTYLMFADSDDWVEADMLECMLAGIEATGADICCCGHFEEDAAGMKTRVSLQDPAVFEGDDALLEWLKSGAIDEYPWDKLYRRSVFESSQCFPKDRYYEDLATTWKLIARTTSVVVIPNPLYHYIIGAGSQTRTRKPKQMHDYWTAVRELYDMFAHRGDEWRRASLFRCFRTIGFVWRWAMASTDEEWAPYWKSIDEMHEFAYEHRSEIGRVGSDFNVRLAVTLAARGGRSSMKTAYRLNQAYRGLSGLVGRKRV